MRALLGVLAASMIFANGTGTAGKDSEIAKQLELHQMRATAYKSENTLTYTGTVPHVGVAAARKDLIGKTIAMYQRLPGNEVGELIGIYEIQDTGPAEGVANGNVIDIWCPNLDACQDFMNQIYADGCHGKVFVQFFNAEG